jgi:hypothetical protein
MGMIWWNHITERERKKWASLAGDGRAKSAWEMFKRESAKPDGLCAPGRT